MAEYGYAGKILKVNLSDRNTTTTPTATYADRFIGGRGFAAGLHWDMVPPDTKALEPDNTVTFVTGPAAGFDGIAGCRWQVSGKTPQSEPEAFSYCNLGGRWGLEMKYTGYDAIAVQGKADKPVYLFIHDGKAEIRDASHLWGKSTFATEDILRDELGGKVSVLTIGPAGENKVLCATVYGEGNASGGGGMGSVMGSKMLKAVVVSGSSTPQAASPEKLQKLVDKIKEMRGGFGGSGGSSRPSPWGIPGLSVSQACYGCGVNCSRQVYPGDEGKQYKSFCQATNVYKKATQDYYGKFHENQLLGTRLCDAWGLDTATMEPVVSWLIACYKEGVLTEEATGLPLSKAGTAEFIEELTRKISMREGFGDVLADGILQAAAKIGKKAQTIAGDFVHTRSNECKDYDPRMFITTGIFYATEPRRPIQLLHGVSFMVMQWLPFVRGDKDALFNTDKFRAVAKRMWGGEIAADFSTYEGKALAAKKIQDRIYARECLILCDLAWHATCAQDPTLEAQILSAITGKNIDESGLCAAGEKVVNLQRAIQLRHGWAGRKDDRLLDYFHTVPIKEGSIFFNVEALMPGPGGKVISRLGSVVDRNDFNKMLSEYYEYRGWDKTSGLPKATALKRLGLEDVAADLKGRGMLG